MRRVTTPLYATQARRPADRFSPTETGHCLNVRGDDIEPRFYEDGAYGMFLSRLER